MSLDSQVATTVVGGIISGSFNIYKNKEIADAAVLRKQAKDEVNKKRRGHGLVSTNIYRAYGEFLNYASSHIPIDRLKFLFLLGGVNIMEYSQISAMNSALDSWAYVGSPHSGIVTETHNSYWNDQIVFATEPTIPSRGGTIETGFNALGRPKGPVFEMASDIPLFWSLDDVLTDPAMKDFVATIDFNALQKINMPWERNAYHSMRDWPNKCINFKENNWSVIDYDQAGFFYFNVFYGNRKGGGFSLGSIYDMAKTAHDSGYSSRASKMISTVLFNVDDMALLAAAHVLKKPKPIKRSTLKKLAYNLFGGEVNIKMSKKGPQQLYDIDSFQDWQKYERLIGFATAQYDDPVNGFSQIFPFAEQIFEFKENAMHNIRDKIPLVKYFKPFIGSVYKQFNLGQPYFSDEPLRFENKKQEQETIKAYEAFKGR